MNVGSHIGNLDVPLAVFLSQAHEGVLGELLQNLLIVEGLPEELDQLAEDPQNVVVKLVLHGQALSQGLLNLHQLELWYVPYEPPQAGVELFSLLPVLVAQEVHYLAQQAQGPVYGRPLEVYAEAELRHAGEDRVAYEVGQVETPDERSIVGGRTNEVVSFPALKALDGFPVLGTDEFNLEAALAEVFNEFLGVAKSLVDGREDYPALSEHRQEFFHVLLDLLGRLQVAVNDVPERAPPASHFKAEKLAVELYPVAPRASGCRCYDHDADVVLRFELLNLALELRDVPVQLLEPLLPVLGAAVEVFRHLLLEPDYLPGLLNDLVIEAEQVEGAVYVLARLEEGVNIVHEDEVEVPALEHLVELPGHPLGAGDEYVVVPAGYLGEHLLLLLLPEVAVVVGEVYLNAGPLGYTLDFPHGLNDQWCRRDDYVALLAPGGVPDGHEGPESALAHSGRGYDGEAPPLQKPLDPRPLGAPECEARGSLEEALNLAEVLLKGIDPLPLLERAFNLQGVSNCRNEFKIGISVNRIIEALIAGVLTHKPLVGDPPRTVWAHLPVYRLHFPTL